MMSARGKLEKAIVRGNGWIRFRASVPKLGLSILASVGIGLLLGLVAALSMSVLSAVITGGVICFSLGIGIVFTSRTEGFIDYENRTVGEDRVFLGRRTAQWREGIDRIRSLVLYVAPTGETPDWAIALKLDGPNDGPRLLQSSNRQVAIEEVCALGQELNLPIVMAGVDWRLIWDKDGRQREDSKF